MTIPTIAPYAMPVAAAAGQRVDWQPDPARALLLVHDMQDYFLDFYNRDQKPVPALLSHIHALRAACDSAGIPVAYTAQPPQQSNEQRGLLQPWWGAGITAQPQRATIAAAIAPRPHDLVITKWRYSAFVSTDLRERMRALGRDQLIVCGVYAHIGCLMTVADAFMHDVEPFLVADAVADFSAAEHAQALDYVARRCGVVLYSAACIQSLAQPAGLPRSLLALRQGLAQMIERPVDAVAPGDNPFDLGLDSIRLMLLLERWTGRGARLGLRELAERDSVDAWWQLMQSRQEAA